MSKEEEVLDKILDVTLTILLISLCVGALCGVAFIVAETVRYLL